MDVYSFCGKKKIEKVPNYFEGWYFKNSNQENSISFIPGIHVENKKKSAFIQVITNSNSYFIPFGFEEFQYGCDPFFIQLGSNYFSLDRIQISIFQPDLSIQGNLSLSHITPIHTNVSMPNIMGFFSYFPFLECNHAILSMEHELQGNLQINDKEINFTNCHGYIEKDWGTSFPNSYIWAQANCFSTSDTSLFLAIADIPFKAFHFTGFICNFRYQNKEYRFATYNGAKLLQYNTENDILTIELKKGKQKIYLTSYLTKGQKLLAPQQGAMKNHINESICSNIQVILEENDEILFDGTSYDCGLEVVLQKS